MKTLQLYGPLPQAKTALDVLSMMGDEKKRKEVYEVLKAVEVEREKLNEAIAVHGKVKKIDGLLHSAGEKEAAAKRLLDDAEWEAGELRTKAKKDTDAARTRVKLREEAADARQKVLSKRDAELTLKLEVREGALDSRAKDLEAGRVEVSKKMAEIIERETKYRDRKKALEAIPAL